MTAAQHAPVLMEACMELLSPQPGNRFIDCTINGGGHSEALLERSAPAGRVLGIDADEEALTAAAARLAGFGSRITLVHRNFRELEEAALEAGFGEVDGILMDLGLSSRQLDTANRGFAFSHDGPLDMRFDASRGKTAAELIATATSEAIEQTLREFGEEPRARRIAQAIVSARTRSQIQTTSQLANLVARAVGQRGRTHPATRTFQALRMAINDELGALSAALPQALHLLRQGARLAVISFHSLEDRIVKNFFASLSGRVTDDLHLPTPPKAPPAEVRIITRRPIMASPEEVATNPRSRSARLRVAERI
jgi:16S rRNA (cytosine1402-N4)-methyltransferase